jgi:nicotinate phosphoribosyltransferase
MVITSLLDTDLYKFTMMQAVLHQFPGAQVAYKFKCRNPGVQLAPYIDEIREEIKALCHLQFSEEELGFMRAMLFIKSDFVDFLGLFKLNEKYITVSALPSGEIDIHIKGPWLHTILFEIPVLAIVNEVYFRNTQPQPDFEEGRRRLAIKINQLNAVDLPDLKIADYGTRRRFSKDWQQEVLANLLQGLGSLPQGRFTGTSNVLFAQRLGVTPLGTMARPLAPPSR